MAIYTILRVYEVPGENRIEAAERMMNALMLHAEKDFYVKDIIREPGEKPGQWTVVKLTPPVGWVTLLIRQLFGK
jgi:hypothetical protein